MEKEPKRYGLIPIICFLLICCSVVLGYAAGTREYWSDSENRELAGFPHAADYKGDADAYMQAFEPFLDDQFPLRGKFVSAYTRFQQKSGRWYVRGVRVMTAKGDKSELSSEPVSTVSSEGNESQAAAQLPAEPFYIGPDYLFLDSYPVSKGRFANYRAALDCLASLEGIQLVDIILPHKNYSLAEGTDGALSEALIIEEANLEGRKASDSAAGIISIDACSLFSDRYGIKERSRMYFKTDIHWNPLGAFNCSELAAQKLAELGVIRQTSVPDGDSFVWQDLSAERSYTGDLGRRFELEDPPAEYIPVYTLKETSSLRYYSGADRAEVKRDEVVNCGIDDYEIDYENLGTKNMLYFRVENPNAPEQKNVLILKDSYQCTTIDYYSAIFSSITVIDPRFDNPPLKDIIKDEEIELVLLMYHQDNFLDEFSEYVTASFNN